MEWKQMDRMEGNMRPKKKEIRGKGTEWKRMNRMEGKLRKEKKIREIRGKGTSGRGEEKSQAEEKIWWRGEVRARKR
jgi:hypothetical protein